MVHCKKALRWFMLFLIIACGLSAGFSILVFIQDVFPTKLVEYLLFLFPWAVPLIMISIGIVSLLPFSEYAYTRQAGINPAVARESMAHQSREQEKRELGLLLGIVGFISILGMNPWHLFYSLIIPFLGAGGAAVLMIFALLLLIEAYRRQKR
ncbi:MAG: hypothetical protein QXN63_03135 [Candidatus Bathyarchaeia archaeon]